MLSRARILSGQNGKNIIAVASRWTATTPPNSQSQVTAAADNLPEFRRPVRQEPGKVRLGFLPEEWFTFFYKKTGVTGPYVFGLTFATYLCSKEWYVMEHEFYNALSFIILNVVAVKKLGPPLAKYLDKELDQIESDWNSGRENTKKNLNEQIEDEKTNQWRSEGQMLLVEAKKANVDMQLEAAYRERLMSAFNGVKSRLDYQVRKIQVEQRVAQRNIVDWVVRQVRASITPDQEKQNIDRCIADLALLAK